MKPLRMCMVCRKRCEKSELIRIVKKSPYEVLIDSTGKASGRGAYICCSEDCIGQAQKRRVLERAFSMQIDSSVYEKLLQSMEDKNYES